MVVDSAVEIPSVVAVFKVIVTLLFSAFKIQLSLTFDLVALGDGVFYISAIRLSAYIFT